MYQLGLSAITRKKIPGEKLILVGGLIILLMLLISIFAPWITLWSPTEIDFSAFLAEPSSKHWFGTDGNGMDVWSRIAHGARLDLSIGIASVLIACLLYTSDAADE